MTSSARQDKSFLETNTAASLYVGLKKKEKILILGLILQYHVDNRRKKHQHGRCSLGGFLTSCQWRRLHAYHIISNVQRN